MKKRTMMILWGTCLLLLAGCMLQPKEKTVTVSLPDGTVVRRFPFLPVAAMVISVFINPFMPFGVAAIYGSALTVKNAVKRSINKDKKDG